MRKCYELKLHRPSFAGVDYDPYVYDHDGVAALCTEKLCERFALGSTLPETIVAEFHGSKVANSLRVEQCVHSELGSPAVLIGRAREESDTHSWLDIILRQFPRGVAWLRVMV